jgi:hypothetical protein
MAMHAAAPIIIPTGVDTTMQHGGDLEGPDRKSGDATHAREINDAPGAVNLAFANRGKSVSL